MQPWYIKAKEELKRLGLSYQDVATLLGVEKPTVGHWMTGIREPNLQKLKKLAEILSMSISQLCGEDAYFVVAKEERALLDKYRNLNPTEKEAFLTVFGVEIVKKNARKRSKRKAK